MTAIGKQRGSQQATQVGVKSYLEYLYVMGEEELPFRQRSKLSI